jgi:hypothetical protein
MERKNDFLPSEFFHLAARQTEFFLVHIGKSKGASFLRRIVKG